MRGVRALDACFLLLFLGVCFCGFGVQAPLGPSVLNRQQKEALRQLNLETPPSARSHTSGSISVSAVSQVTKQIPPRSVLPISGYFPFKSLWERLKGIITPVSSQHSSRFHSHVLGRYPHNTLILAFFLNIIVGFSV